MKKNKVLPFLLVLSAVLVYGTWFGFFGGKTPALQTGPDTAVRTTLPGALPPDALPGGPDDTSEGEPPVSSSLEEPPIPGTPVPPTGAAGSFPLGAPATVATPPAWAGDGLPHDKLFITVERQKYKEKQLTLIIPKLNQNRAVFDGTDLETLNKGVGLFEYAQLPGEGNRNVSLAAHRNGRSGGKITDRAPFYYIDTLTYGDRMYLRDAGHVYEYVYKTTFIVEESDWAPIYSQGFSCLTLLSCEPIGVNTHRIIVQGELAAIHAVGENEEFVFLP